MVQNQLCLVSKLILFCTDLFLSLIPDIHFSVLQISFILCIFASGFVWLGRLSVCFVIDQSHYLVLVSQLSFEKWPNSKALKSDEVR